MAFTTRIRLEKQADGANPNSWGTVLNDNVIDLVDDAIAAYVTVSLSSVDVTLTNLDGTPDQARSAFLELQGTLTNDVNVVIPQQSKGYFVRNQTVPSKNNQNLRKCNIWHQTPIKTCIKQIKTNVWNHPFLMNHWFE